MAITWGGWASGSGTNQFRVGIDFEVIGTTVHFSIYGESLYPINDQVDIWWSGASTGSVTRYRWNASSGQVVLATNRSFSGSRGSAYTLNASVSDIYNGATPSHSRSVTVPALVPATPSTPTVSGVTSSSFTARTTAPASNGSAITGYEWQVSDSASSWPSGVASSTGVTQELTGYGHLANQSAYVRVRARNGVGASAWSGVRTVQMLPQGPNAVSGLTATRQSDTRINLAWTRNATSARPYSSIEIQRRSTSWTTWTAVGTAAGTATSYADTSTIADRRFSYRVRAVNAAGVSGWVEVGTVDTTPAPPTSCAAAKNSAGNITISYARGSDYPTQTEVWHLPGDGSWELLATAAAAQGGTGTYTHVSPDPGVTHQYRVRHKSAAPVLYSTYATSGVVQLAAPPAAPTVTGPGGTLDAAGAMTLTWRHNPTDSSDQTAYQVRYRLVGATTWTTLAKTTSEVSSRVFTAGTFSNGSSVELQVATWGQHATASPWSATHVAVFSATPTVVLSDPVDGDVLSTPTATVWWGYYQAQSSPQAQWQAQLLDATGEVVETLNGSSAAATATFGTVLPDASTWRVRVRVRSAAGLWSAWDTATVTVSYPLPARPIVSAVWQPDTGSVVVSVENPYAPPAPPILTRDPDGTIWFDW